MMTTNTAATVRAAGIILYRLNGPKVSGKNNFSDRIQFLLMQTSYGNNHWTPPKGHVDDEDLSDFHAALRETKEEAGIDRSQIEVDEEFKIELIYQVKDRNNPEKLGYVTKMVTYWLAELSMEEGVGNDDTAIQLSEEHQDYKWLKLEEACKLCEFQDMANAFKKCQEKIMSKYGTSEYK